MLYKTTTLFKDNNLSADTSVATEILSAQVGNGQLDNLNDVILSSFQYIPSTKTETVSIFMYV